MHDREAADRPPTHETVSRFDDKAGDVGVEGSAQETPAPHPAGTAAPSALESPRSVDAHVATASGPPAPVVGSSPVSSPTARVAAGQESTTSATTSARPAPYFGPPAPAPAPPPGPPTAPAPGPSGPAPAPSPPRQAFDGEPDRTGVTDTTIKIGIHAPVTGAAPFPNKAFEDS